MSTYWTFRLGFVLPAAGLVLWLLVPSVFAEVGKANPGITVESISLRSGKETVKAICCRPAGQGPFPAVIVLHGDFGLTGWVKKQAEGLAGKGYLALAVDLYRGEVAKDIEEAHILERGLPEERVLRDLKAAVDYLAVRPDIRKDRLAAIGWDMGGGYALQAATRDRRITAVVLCYGRLITDAKILAGMQAAVLGIFAEKDEGIPADTLKSFQAAMHKADKRLAGLHVFAGAGNGFMDPNSPYHDRPPSRDTIARAWRTIEVFLADEMKPAKP